MNKKILTLCIIHQHPKVLLGMKKRGHGEGKWNGFGGKVEKGETIEEAAIRETKEEAGIEINKINKLGILEFKGSLTESEEMKPKWFHINEIPYNQMWSDDKYWLPMFIKGKRFEGKFLFNKDNEIIDYSLLKLK
jgi:8-oxo-dGTP diphosphatase/2-hydroxy-dATP diphosphatase